MSPTLSRIPKLFYKILHVMRKIAPTLGVDLGERFPKLGFKTHLKLTHLFFFVKLER